MVIYNSTEVAKLTKLLEKEELNELYMEKTKKKMYTREEISDLIDSDWEKLRTIIKENPEVKSILKEIRDSEKPEVKKSTQHLLLEGVKMVIELPSTKSEQERFDIVNSYLKGINLFKTTTEDIDNIKSVINSYLLTASLSQDQIDVISGQINKF